MLMFSRQEWRRKCLDEEAKVWLFGHDNCVKILVMWNVIIM
jgi:hypothetical protein